MDLGGDTGGKMSPEKEPGFSFSFYDVLTWVFQKTVLSKVFTRCDTCNGLTALRPPQMDSASKITPSKTPEASKSANWFKSYTSFKNFFAEKKYFPFLAKFLKLA